MDGGQEFWAWGSWHTRDCSVSFMGAFVEGLLHLRFQWETFFQAHLLHFVLLRCFQVEAKVGLLPKQEKQCPP
jgi:hypothetical protein